MNFSSISKEKKTKVTQSKNFDSLEFRSLLTPKQKSELIWNINNKSPSKT